jgi:hypothetical protein
MQRAPAAAPIRATRARAPGTTSAQGERRATLRHTRAPMPPDTRASRRRAASDARPACRPAPTQTTTNRRARAARWRAQNRPTTCYHRWRCAPQRAQMATRRGPETREPYCRRRGAQSRRAARQWCCRAIAASATHGDAAARRGRPATLAAERRRRETARWHAPSSAAQHRASWSCRHWMRASAERAGHDAS